MPRIVDHAERRNAIARAARRAIAQSGLDGVTMRSIAAAGGVTTGAVTHYFANKDEILSATLEVITNDTLERLRSRTTSSIEGFLDLLELAMPTSDERRDEWRAWLAFWARGSSDGHPLSDDDRRIRTEWLALLEEKVRHLEETGAATLADTPAVIGYRISHIVNGIALEACLDPARWPADRQSDELAAMVTPMLTP